MEGDNNDERSSGSQLAVITITLGCSQFSMTCVEDMLKVVETFYMDYHKYLMRFIVNF